MNKLKFLLRKYMILLFFLSLLPSCSTIEKSVTVGLIAGGVGGAVIAPGLVREDKKKALVLGALVGMALGGIGGYFTHKKLDERDEKTRKDTIFNLENFGYHPTISVPLNKNKDTPPVMNPKVEKIWIEPRVEGHKYISGHYQWVITDEARWGNKKEDKEGDDKKSDQHNEQDKGNDKGNDKDQSQSKEKNKATEMIEIKQEENKHE
ncbi:MAG: hypothetical protein HQK49_09145 [Oligoflexia bacterium]|nr:hypothetical protein [Oligoflexia bacterium]